MASPSTRTSAWASSSDNSRFFMTEIWGLRRDHFSRTPSAPALLIHTSRKITRHRSKSVPRITEPFLPGRSLPLPCRFPRQVISSRPQAGPIPVSPPDNSPGSSCLAVVVRSDALPLAVRHDLRPAPIRGVRRHRGYTNGWDPGLAGATPRDPRRWERFARYLAELGIDQITALAAEARQ
jgi:hypothetical protein